MRVEVDGVSVALDGVTARIRDSKGQADATVAAPAWGSFLAMVKGEEQLRR